MAIRATSELHRRRFSRNMGVGLTLGALIALIFGLTLVKLQRSGEVFEGYDHQTRPALTREVGQ